jgi:DNA polymerase-1
VIRTFLIIDGYNVFIRYYLGSPEMDSNGEPVGGVTGFVKALKSYVDQHRPTSAIVVWDGEGGSERRRSIRAEYKAGRKVRLNREYDFDTSAGEERANMERQRELVGEYLRTLGVPQMAPAGVEADDTIAYLCRSVLEEDALKIVVSNDRDLLQLVGPTVKVYNHRKKRMYDSGSVLEDVGCVPENYAVVKAICGDRGDNVNGVKGVGPKTLTKLCPALRDTPTTLAEALDRIDEVARLGKSAHAKNVVALGRGTILENMTLVDLSSPLMSPSAARLARGVVYDREGSRSAFSPAGIRLKAMKDGVVFHDNLDSTFKQLAVRRALWLKSVADKESDV